MKILALSVLIIVTLGCASYPGDQFCRLSPTQESDLIKLLIPLQEHLNSEFIKYAPYITKEGYIFRQDGICWVKLSPTDTRSDFFVQHGEFSVEVFLQSMSLGRLAEIEY